MFATLIFNYLISQVTSLLPLLSIGFVSILLICKLYIRIRSKFNITVNCWFCNQNTKVAYNDANSWTCPGCEQYNGFSKDGDYNREIYEQLDCSSVSRNGGSSSFSAPMSATNGFCAVCNENQRIKVERIAQFEPKKESRFDEELKVYKAQLEEQYGLCSGCDRHLKRVLHEKKKMVLGSKFLDLILKGTETLRNGPQLQQMKDAQRQKIKTAIRWALTVFAVINVILLFRNAPTLSKEKLNSVLPNPLGGYVFIALSHVLTLGKVMFSYLELLGQLDVCQKVQLFAKTVFMMMMYSMGLKSQQFANVDFGEVLTALCSLAIICGSFLYKLVDRFALSRYTLILSVWSLFAADVFETDLVFLKDVAVCGASVMTLVLCLKSKKQKEAINPNTTASSFHRIYSEDYLSDESRDTISMLNGSSNSYSPSNASVRSFATSPIYMMKSPIAASDLNLNRTQMTPFRGFCDDTQSVRSRYTGSLSGTPCNFPPNRGMFASNIELNRRRPNSMLDVNSVSLNNSFVNSSLNSSEAQRAPSRFTATPSLASPYSFSSCNVYQQQRSNVLSPTRFSTNSLLTNPPAPSWVSGGFFNNTKGAATTDKINFFLNGTQTDELSRSSSHSSGFESHTSLNNPGVGGNISRENSFCPEPMYPPVQDTVFPSNSGLVSAQSQSAGSLHNLSTSSSSFRPLPLDCHQEYAKPVPVRSSFNAFNLNKITEELPAMPSFQRGSLLSKWKEQQEALSS